MWEGFKHVVKGDLTEEMTSEWRPEGSEGENHAGRYVGEEGCR